MSNNWWIDDQGPLSREDPPDTVYLCEGDEGDTIRFTTSDLELATVLCNRFNTDGTTRELAEPVLRCLST